MAEVKKFYDDIANYYHLIYSNWEEGIKSQAAGISKIIKKNWNISNPTILDCTCGIGTQALGLASLGYTVTGSDLSENAVKRAKREAKERNLKIDYFAGDVRNIWQVLKNKFDIVISCDNSLPHLLNDTEIRNALKQMFKCVKKGGGVVVSVRNYEKDEKSGLITQMYGVRQTNGSKVIVFQTRDYYKKQHYKVNLYFVFDPETGNCKTKVFRSEYYAISTNRIIELMQSVGFKNVRQIDDCFFQPIIIGNK